MMKLRARFNGEVLVPEGPVDLPTDRILDLSIENATDPPRGSPAALLAAMTSLPHIPKDDLDELARQIDQNRISTTDRGCFDDLE